MNKRMFDDSFKKMVVDLSFARGSVKEVADELGINESLLSNGGNVMRGRDKVQST